MNHKSPSENESFQTWIRSFLQWICPDHLYEEIEGDLIQKFNRDIRLFGEKRAKRILTWNVIRFFRPGIVLRNKFSFELNQLPMLKNYFKSTYRHISKSKLNFVFKIGGLTLAMFSFLIIAMYVSFQLSFDTYHTDYKNIYRVNTERKENEEQGKYGIVPTSLGAMMQGKFGEIKAQARVQIGNSSQVHYQQKIINCGVFAADSTLFDVLTFNFIEGGREALRNSSSIVLTKSIASKLLGSPPFIHKLVTLNGDKKLYEVTAIIEDINPNSHFKVDAFTLFLDESNFTANNISSPTEFLDQSGILYLKLEGSSNPDAFASKLEALVDERIGKRIREENGFHIFLEPIKSIYLDTSFKYEFARKGSALYLYLFIALGVLLLLTASINYINLSITDFSSRRREMGVRKVMGSRKSQIALQVILETSVYCLFSLGLSLLMLYVLFPNVVVFIEPHLKLIMLTNKEVVSAVALTVLILIIVSTCFPAYWLSTSKIATDLKGAQSTGQYSLIGRTLLIVQFVISIICISATLTVNSQLDYIHRNSLGINRKNLVVITMPEDLKVQQMQTLKHELKSVSGVENVSNGSFRIGGGYWKDWYTVEDGDETRTVELYEVFSDDDLFNTLGMKLIEGRTFNAGLPADSGAAFVINETAARELGWEHPVGKRIFTHPEESGRWDGTVVGVVGDVNISSLHEKIPPLVMRLPWQNRYPEYFVYIRINGSMKETLIEIEKKYKDILPAYPFELDFVDDYYNEQYEKENRAYASLQFATVIIILVSSLGILSLSIYMSIKRRKEFGIRKVLGATVKQIAWLQVSHFFRLTLIANVIALPVGYWLMKEWLEEFAYHTELSSLMFLSVLIISLMLVIISGGYSAWKSGNRNPIDVINVQ